MTEHVWAISNVDTYFAACPIVDTDLWRDYRAEVRRVKDGDTALVWMDEGDGRMLAITVRFEHVNCPERSAEGGEAARYFTSQLLPAGTWVKVRTRNRRDDHGRLLADVFKWVSGRDNHWVDVNREIVLANHGTVRR